MAGAAIRAGDLMEGPFFSPVPWPPGFVELCVRERAGEIPPDLQSMKMEAGDTPHHTYPLRDVESQFNVEHQHGLEVDRLGSLSFGQVLREAYPGAVYYYATRPYRVCQAAGRLMEPGVIRKVLLRAQELSNAGTLTELNNETIECLNEMACAAELPGKDIGGEIAGPDEGITCGAAATESRLAQVIPPGGCRKKDD